jgi:hypothetical protein
VEDLRSRGRDMGCEAVTHTHSVCGEILEAAERLCFRKTSSGSRDAPPTSSDGCFIPRSRG